MPTPRKEPISLSTALGLRRQAIIDAGVVDVTLNVDTRLFVDPLLLADASDQEFAAEAVAQYRRHFSDVISLISRSAQPDDLAWRSAARLLSFPEMRFTHLGYSVGSAGSGAGRHFNGSLMRNAAEAIRLGIDDPNLFLVVALFERGWGADRISDMTTGVIYRALVGFTQRASSRLGVLTRSFEFKGEQHLLPANPVSLRPEPILFMPSDVVRDLPTATDWDSICSAAAQNQELRDRVGRHIGEIWRSRNSHDKAMAKSRILSRRESFLEILELLHAAQKPSYDLGKDPGGELYPEEVADQICRNFPLDLTQPNAIEPSERCAEIVEKVVSHFQSLIESNGVWEMLYEDDRHRVRRERAAQRLFFAVASAYCQANNLDLSPEADGGNGPVDFKISGGHAQRVIVELKLSRNPKVVDGYSRQMAAYLEAERPIASHYVVLDVGGLS